MATYTSYVRQRLLLPVKDFCFLNMQNRICGSDDNERATGDVEQMCRLRPTAVERARALGQTNRRLPPLYSHNSSETNQQLPRMTSHDKSAVKAAR